MTHLKKKVEKKVVLALTLLAVAVGAGVHGAPALEITPTNPSVTVGQTVQFAVSGGVTPSTVAAGGWHTCVLLSDQSVQCTGRNNFGQLGDGTLNNASGLVDVTGVPAVTAIAPGFEFTCALAADRTMWCWGSNYTGQLGDGTIGGYSSSPGMVHGLSNVAALAIGGFHSCAILADSTVRCWGRNADGQVGNGTLTDATLPQQVTGLGTVAALSAGGYHTCALMADRTIRCWGRNDDGQLGDGTGRSSSTPVQVSGITNAVAVRGGGYHTCALLSDGTVKCWGRNSFGQIGVPTSTPSIYAPVTVSGIEGVVTLAAGGYHNCAVPSDRSVRCWGEGDYGELGNGSMSSSSTPVTVTGIVGPDLITPGAWHTCALMPNQPVWCWGQNDFGQLGNHGTGEAPTAVRMSGIGASSVTWTSSDTSIATIDANGLAHGLSRGTTTITATDSSGASGGTVLSVTDSSATLSVSRRGDGSGSVTSNPAGVDCGSVCAASFTTGTQVTLTARPLSGSVFAGWSGCDSVSGTTCSVTMSTSRTIQATFSQQQSTLAVQKSGTGSGTVTSNPVGINCGNACATSFTNGTQVMLSVAAAPGSVFAGWSGCDSVSGTTCSVTMTASRTVQATFNQQLFTLSVRKSNVLLGDGTVTSSPAGINCGTDCSAPFVGGTTLTLTATPALLSLFNGWSGCDSVSGTTCTVTIRSDTSVTASFIGASLF
jgi:alpha-tubulin suppressor-like RCC1 family protein